MMKFGAMLAIGAALMLIAAGTIIYGAPYSDGPDFEWRALREFPSGGQRAPVAVLFLSGDMGFRFGMSGTVASALGKQGMAVEGFSSPLLFARRRTLAQVDRIVANALRIALERSRASRIVLAGQSYGADIVATAAPRLPPDLRAKVAAIVLIVPARTVYFRADPLGFAYRGAPDARPLEPVRRIGWAPVLCIHGVEEQDSLCPPLRGSAVRVTGLPGGHYLRHDDGALIAAVLGGLRAAVPALGKG
ncbi:MAG: AcvB/VirJ family lysyl-phosphatidylglycerol hydrolase [Sphingobium sp.]